MPILQDPLRLKTSTTFEPYEIANILLFLTYKISTSQVNFKSFGISSTSQFCGLWPVFHPATVVFKLS